MSLSSFEALVGISADEFESLPTASLVLPSEPQLNHRLKLELSAPRSLVGDLVLMSLAVQVKPALSGLLITLYPHSPVDLLAVGYRTEVTGWVLVEIVAREDREFSLPLRLDTHVVFPLVDAPFKATVLGRQGGMINSSMVALRRLLRRH